MLSQWRELIRAEGTLAENVLDEREAALTEATRAALAAGGPGRDAILAAFRGATEEDLRSALASVVLPPHTTAAVDPDAYRSHPEVRFDARRMPIRPALGLPVAEDLVGRFEFDPEAGRRSWFGMCPALPVEDLGTWEPPRRRDGKLLTHVVQVDMREAAEEHAADLFGRTGLPDEGIVSLYHDLETFGWERSDEVGAWAVVWRSLVGGEEPDLVLVSEERAEAPCFPINAQVMPTAPSPLDVADLDEEEWARYDRAVNWLEQSAQVMNLLATPADDLTTPWDEDYEPPPPASRMGGFAYGESTEELRQVLGATLPLGPGDEHVLLFDVNPLAITGTDALIDWFHGGRHLEVWLRRSDLDARDFSRVWCVIRTDA